MGGTVVAPGGHGTCGAFVLDVVAPDVVPVDVVVPGALVVFGVDGVDVPVPVPEFLGWVDVPVPAPAGTHGGFASGWVGVVGGTVAGVLGVGAVIPDGVGAIVPDGVGAVVPDGVGAVDGV